MKKMFYPDGTAINSIFAVSGHLNQITMDARDNSITDTPVVTYELDIAQDKHKLIRTTGNEVSTSISFDQVTHRVLDYTTLTKSGIVAEDIQLNYDLNGNIVEIKDGKTPSLSMSYSYDNLNRMISSTMGTSPVVDYQYSVSGNLLKKGNTKYTYSNTSQPNAVKSAAVDNGSFVNTYHYIYDENGNMISRNGGSPGFGEKLFYDSENRLTKLEDETGNKLGEYLYDQSGQRTKKIFFKRWLDCV